MVLGVFQSRGIAEKQFLGVIMIAERMLVENDCTRPPLLPMRLLCARALRSYPPFTVTVLQAVGDENEVRSLH